VPRAAGRMVMTGAGGGKKWRSVGPRSGVGAGCSRGRRCADLKIGWTLDEVVDVALFLLSEIMKYCTNKN
jgi:hypothetical protein